MNIVDYGIRMRDMASAPLGRFTQQVRQSMPLTQRFSAGVVRMTAFHKLSYNELQKRIKETENIIRNSTIKSEIRAAKRELSSLQRQATKRGIDGGGSSKSAGLSVAGMLKGGLAVGAVMAVGRQVGQFLGSSVQESLERQQIQTSFNVLAGDEKKGSELTKQLVDLQKNTILGKEVFKNAQTMMGFGFDSTEVLDNMKMLGDVSMGDTEKFQSLTLAFSQVRAAGKLQGQDLLQLVNAGFNPLEQMAKRTGKSIGQLKDEMGKGNISFADIQQAFKDATSEGGKFDNMLAKIAETPAGKIKQLEGAWDEFKIKAGGAMMPLVNTMLNFANKMMPLMEQMIEPMTNGMQTVVEWIGIAKPYFVDMLQPAVNFIKQLVSDTGGWMSYLEVIKTLFVEHIYPVIKRIVSAVFGMVGKLIEFVKNSQLLKDLYSFIGNIMGGIWDMIGGLINAMSWLFNNIMMPLINAIEKAYRFIAGSEKSPTKVISKPKIALPTPVEIKQTDILTDISKNISDNKQSAQTSEKAIASGGQKIVNIQVGKFFDNINFHTSTLKEATSDIENTVLECLSRVLMNGATIAQQ